MNTGNDLLVQVKANQPGLLDGLEEAARLNQSLGIDENRASGRLRQEDRLVETFDLDKAFKNTDWASYLSTGIRVTRTTLIRSAATGLWSKRHEVAWYVSSARLDAKAFAEAIRGHWGIENRSPYVRDVTMAEDASRIRINPGIFARLRTCALNILRVNRVDNVAKACWLKALSIDRILAYPCLNAQN